MDVGTCYECGVVCVGVRKRMAAEFEKRYVDIIRDTIVGGRSVWVYVRYL